MFTFDHLGTPEYGRLGNQMFQLAFLYSISKNMGTHCLLSDSTLENRYLNINKLFNIDYIFGDIKHEFVNYYEKSLKYYDVSKDIDPNQNINFHGFFQSHKYFDESIFDLFIFNEILERDGDMIYNKICDNVNVPIVSLHVRRTDYLNLAEKYIIPEKDYYDNAIMLLKYKIGNYKIIVFSDDIEWCIYNIIDPRIIHYSNNSDLIDMYLMSICDHNIITNSTFSWWGAYLNKNNNKIVISPSKWMTDNFEQPDIYVSGWNYL